MSSEIFLEVESKFAVDDTTAVPDLMQLTAAESLADPVERNLSAIYYDTPDLRLTRAKITLRRRTGGNDDGWHIKLPGDIGRTELHALLGDATTPPEELLEAVRAIVRNEALAPIARVDNTRTETLILGADGEVIAEFCDDRVTAQSFLPGGQEKSWREWEVELSPAVNERLDGAALLHEATSLLLNQGARVAESPSKLTTALGDSVNQAPLPPHMDTTALEQFASDSPVRVVMDALRTQRNKLVVNDPKVRADEPDSVHQMRVATRELRSLLATFEGILNADQVYPLEAELKLLADLLGVARDAEVVEDRLVTQLDADTSGMIDDIAATRIRDTMRRKYERAHKRIVKALSSPRYLQLLDDLDATLASPPLTAGIADESEGTEEAAVAPADILFEHLSEAYSKVLTRFEQAEQFQAGAGKEPLTWQDRADALHDVRKAVKKLRYCAVAAEASELDTKKLIKACAKAQDVLGEYQDSVATRQRLEKFTARARRHGEDTFTYGMLYQHEIERGDKALRKYPKALAKVQKAFKKSGQRDD